MSVEKISVTIPAIYGDEALPVQPPEPSWDVDKAQEHARIVGQIEAEIDSRVAVMAEDHATRREQVAFTDSSGTDREVSQRRFVRIMRREKAIRKRMVAAYSGQKAVAAY